VREYLGERLSDVVVGLGEEKNTQMGPLIDTAAVARVDRIVEDSASYAKAIVRGGPVTDGPLAAGAFYRPSLIEVEDLDAPIIQQCHPLETDTDSQTSSAPAAVTATRFIQPHLIGAEPTTAGAKVHSGRDPAALKRTALLQPKLVNIGHELGTNLT
jgi:Aldehyde dehydrogenase family